MLRVALLLTLVGCVTELDTSEIESDLTVSQWSDDIRIYGQTTVQQPGLAFYGNRLHMVHAGSSSNPTHLWWSKFDGTDWTTNVRISGYTTSEPSLVVHGGVMHLFFRATSNSSGDKKIMHAQYNGSTWSAPVTGSADYMNSGPSTTVHDGRLLVGFCTGGDTTKPSKTATIFEYSNGTYSAYASYFLGATNVCKNVSLASFGGTLFIQASAQEYGYIWDPGDFYIYEWRRTRTTQVGQRLAMSSKTPMSMVVCDGYLHTVHGGNQSPAEIWWAYRSSTSTQWTEDLRVPNQSSNAGAALGCFGTTPVMVHNGNGTNDLWYSTFD